MQTFLMTSPKNVAAGIKEVYAALPADTPQTLSTFRNALIDKFGGELFYNLNDSMVDFLEAVQTTLPLIDLSLRNKAGPTEFGDLITILSLAKGGKVKTVSDFLGVFREIEREYYVGVDESKMLSSMLSKMDLENVFQMESLVKHVSRYPLEDILAHLGSVLYSIDVSTASTLDTRTLEICEHSLKSHFNIKRITDLGHGKLSDILHNLNEKEPPSIINATALSISYLDLSTLNQTLSKHTLIDAIVNAPLLHDLETSVNWCLVDIKVSTFASFITNNLQTLQPVLAEKGVVLVESCYERFMLVRRNADVKEYKACLAGKMYYEAVCALVAMVYQNTSIKHLSLAMLRQTTIEHLVDLSSMEDAVTLVVRSVALLPDIMQIGLMKAVMLPAFKEADEGWVVRVGVALKVLGYKPAWVYTLGVAVELARDVEVADEMILGGDEMILGADEMMSGGDEIVIKSTIDTYQEVHDISLAMDPITEQLTSYQLTSNQSTVSNQNITSNTPEEDAMDTSTTNIPDDNTTDTNHEQIILNIRQQEFGLDLQPEELTSPLAILNAHIIETQRSRNTRALTRLSHELYSQDSHFVLELLQNADDNVYPRAVVPTLEFIVEAGGVVVLNNEVGFREGNVRALCDVGKSTKVGEKESFIGQKGIGFKSVFRVCDRPEIHSGGFHVRFDCEDFIVPRWVHDTTDKHTLLDGTNAATRIVLPFNASVLSKSPKRMLQKFNDIKPVVLLFLRRLSRLVIVDRISNQQQVIEKRVVSSNEIVLVSNETKMRWRMCESSYRIKAKGGEVASTLKIALPMDYCDEKGCVRVDVERWMPMSQDTFAFLPLRAYGFRFVLHGDFAVPSSREDVDHDSPWNEQLRSCIPSLFLSFFQSLKDEWHSHSAQSRAHHASIIMKLLPLEGELFGFFKPVSSAIIQLMKRTACIVNASGDWSVPSRVAGFPNKSIQMRDDLSQVMIREALGVEMIHQDFYLSEQVQRVLGVQVIDASHLLAVLKYVSSQEKTRSDHVVERVMKHFVLLLDTETELSKAMLLDAFKALPLFRLRGSLTLTSISAINYFYLDSEDVYYESCVKHYTFFSRMNILDFGIYPSLREDKTLLKRLLTHLQIQTFTEKDIVENHILQDLATHKLATPESTLVEYTFFLASYYSRTKQSTSTCQLIETLKHTLPLLTTQGTHTLSATHNLHLPKYLSGYFSSKEVCFWNTLTNAYQDWFEALALPHLNALEEVEAFFRVLGLTAHLYISQTRTDVSAFPRGQLAHPDQKYRDDYTSEELMQIFKVFAELNATLSMDNYNYYVRFAEGIVKLCKALSGSWVGYYCDFMKSSTFAGSDAVLHVVEQGDSTFLKCLRDSTWLPSDKGTIRKGCDLYAASQDIKNVFFDAVEYSAVSNLVPEFAAALQIKTSINATDLTRVLVDWVTAGGVHEFDLDTLKRIYKVLLTAPTAELPHLFIPLSSDFSLTKKETGVFVEASSCVWSDPNSILSGWQIRQGKLVTGKVVLSLIFTEQSGMKDIFKRLGIQQKPVLSDFIEQLSHHAQVADTAECARRQFALISVILSDFNLDDIKQHFNPLLAFIPTHHNIFVSLQHSVLLNDDERQATLFYKYPDVSFIGAQGQIKYITPEITNFFRLFGIKTFSEAIGTTPVPLGTAALPPSQDLLQMIINAFVTFLSRFGVHFNPRMGFKLVLSDQLELQLALHGHAEFITRPYHIETTPTTYILYFSRSGLKMMGELFRDLAMRIDTPRAILEDIRSYFNQICQLIGFPEMVKSQLKQDKYISVESALIDVVFHVEAEIDGEEGEEGEDGEVYEEVVYHTQKNNDEQQSLELIENGEVADSRKRVERPNDSPEMLLRQRKQKHVAREIPTLVLNNELKDSYEAYLSLNQTEIHINKTEIVSLMSLDGIRLKNVTGLVGEELAFLHLRKLHQNNPNIQVKWINEGLETGKPYDLEIFDNVKREIVEFVEVKATQFRWRGQFELSSNEWNFARVQGEKFTILRVSNVAVAGPGETMMCSVVRFNDPHMLAKRRVLKLQHQLVVFPDSQ